MSSQTESGRRPTFYTVTEAARIMRCNRSTLYRAIREGAFPAVRVRTRYVVPVVAVDQLAADAVTSGECVDVARIAMERRTEREVARLSGGASR